MTGNVLNTHFFIGALSLGVPEIVMSSDITTGANLKTKHRAGAGVNKDPGLTV